MYMARDLTTATYLMGVAGDQFPRLPGIAAGVQDMFHAVFDKYNIDGAYFLFSIAPKDLPAFVEFAKISGMPGFGVTMPHKNRIIPLLDDMSEDCKLTETVNLVTIKDGKTFGHNTDGIGFCGKWDKEGINLTGKRVLILGAGAITGTIANELSARGAESFRILNRTVANAESMANMIKKLTNKAVSFGPITNEELEKSATIADVLVQATPLGGMGGGQFESLDFIDKLPKDALVADVTAVPIETELLKKARANNHNTSDGADMLMYQMPETMRAYFGNGYDFNDDVIIEIAGKSLK